MSKFNTLTILFALALFGCVNDETSSRGAGGAGAQGGAGGAGAECGAGGAGAEAARWCWR